MKKNKIKIGKLDLLAFMLMIAVFAVLLLCNIMGGDHWINSDMSAELIFSNLLASKGEILSTSDWYYTTEFHVFYTQIIMVPLLWIFDSWAMVRFLTNIITYILLFISYFYFIKPLHIKRSIAMFTSIFLLLPFSEALITYVQLGNTFMLHIIVIFFYMGMFFRLADRKEEYIIHKFTFTCCYILAACVGGLSGARYLLAVQMPVLITSIIYVMHTKEFSSFRKTVTKENLIALLSGERERYVRYAVLGIVSASGGYLLNRIAVVGKYDFQNYKETSYVPIYQGIFLERLQDIFGGIARFFGYIPDAEILTLEGVLSFIALLLIFGIVFLTTRCRKLIKMESEKKEDRNHIRFCIFLFIVTLLLNIAVLIFTTETIESSYFITIFMFVIPLLAYYFQTEKLMFDRWVSILLLGICMTLITTVNCYFFLNTDKNMEKREVSKYLVENNYHFGYATYWNSNVITELTNGVVEVANIENLETMNLLLWSSPKKYYSDNYHEGEVFLLLDQQEWEQHGSNLLESGGAMVYQDSYYTVIIYDNKMQLLSDPDR